MMAEMFVRGRPAMSKKHGQFLIILPTGTYLVWARERGEGVETYLKVDQAVRRL